MRSHTPWYMSFPVVNLPTVNLTWVYIQLVQFVKVKTCHASQFIYNGTFSVSRTFIMKTVEIRVKFLISRKEYKTG